MKCNVIVLLICVHFAQSFNNRRPHIFLILADDLGFNDIGFHGSDQIPTPNIDALSAFGIGLNRFYVPPMCTPSRSALLTGKYPINIGMQHHVIVSDQPWGLGLNEKLMPEYLKEVGYNTHIIGKWHLGFFEKKYTPCFRGFDSHFGYLGAYIDYFNHSLTRTGLPVDGGFDMRKNLSLAEDTTGTYATDLFTNVAIETIKNHPNNDTPLFMYLPHLAPHSGNRYELLQAPNDEIDKLKHIKNEERRKYAAMVTRLDNSIGKLVRTLGEKNMLENSVIIFCSDNGAPVIGDNLNFGSNVPLRGQKDSPWEGAIRTVGAIWSPYLQKKERVSNQLFHITDLLPTIAHIAGVEIKDTNLDGHNIWDALSLELKSPRSNVLGNLDDVIGYSSYIKDQWKYVNGTTYFGIYDNWLHMLDPTEKHSLFENYGMAVLNSAVGQELLPFSNWKNNQSDAVINIELLRNQAIVLCTNTTSVACNPLVAPCIFNIWHDPCERINLVTSHPDVLEIMEMEITRFRKSAKEPRNKPSDPRSNPKNFNNTWTWWYDELGINKNDSIILADNKFTIFTLVLMFNRIFTVL